MMPGTPAPTGPMPGRRRLPDPADRAGPLPGGEGAAATARAARSRRRSTPRSSRGGRAYLRAFFSLGRAASRAACAPRWCCRAGRSAASARPPRTSRSTSTRRTATWPRPPTGRCRARDMQARHHRAASICELGDSCPNGGRVQVPAGGALALESQGHRRAEGGAGAGPLRRRPVGPAARHLRGAAQRYQDILMAYLPDQGRGADRARDGVDARSRWRPTAAGPSFLDALRNLRAQDGVAARRLLLRPGLAGDVVPDLLPTGTCTAGLSYLADGRDAAARQVGAGVGFAGTLAGETLVHEIGHQHGRSHTECGGGAGPDPRFPYDGGQHRRLGLRLPEHAPALADRHGPGGAQGLHGLLQPAMDQRLHLRRPGHPPGGGQRRRLPRCVTAPPWPRAPAPGRCGGRAPPGAAAGRGRRRPVGPAGQRRRGPGRPRR